MPAAFNYTNRFNAANLVATPSNGGNYTSAAFDSGFPAVNITSPDPTKVAKLDFVRSGTGSFILPYFQFHASTQSTIRTYSLLNVRLPASVTQVDIAAYNGAGANLGSYSYTAANLVPIPGTTDRYNLHGVLSADTNALAVGLIVYCPINTADYLEFGHVRAGPAFIAADGVDANWLLTYVDPAPIEEAWFSGTSITNALRRRKQISTQINATDYAQTMGTPGNASVQSWRDMCAVAGMSSPILALPRYGTTAEELHTMQTLGTYGRAISLPQIRHDGGNFFATGELVLREFG